MKVYILYSEELNNYGNWIIDIEDEFDVYLDEKLVYSELDRLSERDSKIDFIRWEVEEKEIIKS